MRLGHKILWERKRWIKSLEEKVIYEKTYPQENVDELRVAMSK